MEEKIAQVKKQLDSNSEREKLDALKKLLGTLSKPATLTSGQHSAFFPLVVKNVASTSLEVRKLVYIYLLRFAHLEPDLALLSINTFQKDLGDPNPLIRAMALRLLSGIGSKVSVIQAVVVLAVKKCAADTSPYVRKSAALSLIKCYE
jgi:AP-3 complex subunit beta